MSRCSSVFQFSVAGSLLSSCGSSSLVADLGSDAASGDRGCGTWPGQNRTCLKQTSTSAVPGSFFRGAAFPSSQVCRDMRLVFHSPNKPWALLGSFFFFFHFPFLHLQLLETSSALEQRGVNLSQCHFHQLEAFVKSPCRQEGERPKSHFLTLHERRN